MELEGLILKLKASPAGGARIITIVNAHFKTYGPKGVPNGFVDVQKLVHGRTPCLEGMSVKIHDRYHNHFREGL